MALQRSFESSRLSLAVVRSLHSNAMQLFKSTLLFSLIVCVSVCADKREAFKEHNRRLKRFACREPQPRVLELEDLRNEEMKELIKRGLKDAVSLISTCVLQFHRNGTLKKVLNFENINGIFLYWSYPIFYHKNVLTANSDFY